MCVNVLYKYVRCMYCTRIDKNKYTQTNRSQTFQFSTHHSCRPLFNINTNLMPFKCCIPYVPLYAYTYTIYVIFVL